MPFLKPLASDLLILEEQRRQKRRMRDQVAADKAEQQRIDRLKKRELKQKSFFGFNDKSDRRGQVHRGSMASEDVGENIDDGDDWSDMNSGSNASSFSSGDALLARSRKKKNKIQMFGSSIGDSISEKKKCVAQFFKNMTTILNFPSKDEILLDGFEAPLSSRQHYRRNRTEEGESELEKKLREAIQKEREVAKREEQEEHEVGKGGISLFKKAKSKFSNWALSFWYRPVIDYSAIREWAAVPFRLKGQDIVLDEEAEEMMREHSEVESDDTVSRKMLVKRDSKGDSWDDVDFSERDREGKSDISDSSFTSDANSSPADIAVSVSVEDRCTTCDVVAATVSDNEDRVDGEKSNDGPTVVQLLAPSTTPALLPVATPVSEQSHIASAGSGGAGSFSPPYALSLRGLDLTSDSSSAFKSVVVVQPAILPVASTSLPSLHADEVDFLMQRHHVLISSGRSTSTPIVGAVGGRFSHGVNADPLCSSMLRYLSGGLLSMDEAIEDKSEFDNDGEVEGEREMEFVHEDSKYGLPSLLGGMEDICTLETTDTDNYLAGSRYDMYSGLPYNKHGRSSAVREQRAYCI